MAQEGIEVHGQGTSLALFSSSWNSVFPPSFSPGVRQAPVTQGLVPAFRGACSYPGVLGFT